METVRAETTTACLSGPLLFGKSIWTYKYYLLYINSLGPPQLHHTQQGSTPHPENGPGCVLVRVPGSPYSVRCESVVCVGALKVREKQSLYLFIDLLSSDEERK